MTATIYAYGCTTCGVTGVLVQRAQRAYPQASLVNSQYDGDARIEHAAYLKQLNAPTDNYLPVLVIDGEAQLLSTWKP